MSNPIFVDTGYVIALINQNDQHHQQALQLSEKYERYPLVTTDAILLEERQISVALAFDRHFIQAGFTLAS
jgi:predicted nucleic acid-binding protein